MTGLLEEVIQLEESLQGGDAGMSGGSPARMGLLYRLLLLRLLRQGESSGRTVGRLLELAEESAGKGMVAAALPGEIRGELVRAAAALRGLGAWDGAAPLWWEPLPVPGEMERMWSWVAASVRLPEDGDAVAAMERAVEASILGEIYRELESDGGELGLKAEGVGAEGRRSSHRSDEVRYLSGTEPELLASRPHLAAFIQWCLAEVGPRLAGHPALRERLGGMAPAAPQTAMLARYEGPSGGYSRHLDNPGGDDDNGRALSLVIYLNPREHCPAGGELEVWKSASPSSTESSGAEVWDLAARGRSRRGRVAVPAGSDARRRGAGDAVSSLSPDNAAGGPARTATLWAQGGCGPSAASLVGDDATASPSPRSLHLNHKPPVRGPFDFCHGLLEPWVPVSPCGGNAVLADARRVPHRVRPLEAGPARWTLVLWFRDDLPATAPPPLRSPTPAELLAGIDNPPLPPGSVLLREIAGPPDDPTPAVTLLQPVSSRIRCGLVATTFGAGPALVRWCRHHLELGVDHVLLVFDRPDEPAERDLLAELRSLFLPEHLTLWKGPAEAAQRWPDLDLPEGDPLRRAAEASGGPAAGAALGASTSVAARQTLHASAALAAARGGELGGAPLDWLVHLDDDELLWPQGTGHGGSSIAEHFAALEASDLAVARYVVHELLHPWTPGSSPRFKLNPSLATLRLGTTGWREVLAELGIGPYFVAHTNGKAAVRVSAAAGTAGVHGWHLSESAEHQRTALLDGPCLLHFPVPTAESFRRKLSHRVQGAASSNTARLFPHSHAEAEAIRRLTDAVPTDRDDILDSLYRELTTYGDRETHVLEAAELLLSPDLPFGPPIG